MSDQRLFAVRIDIAAADDDAAELALDEIKGSIQDATDCGVLADIEVDVGDLEEHGDERHQALVELARDRYAIDSDNNIEVDDDARLNIHDGGVWVQAWVHLDNLTLEERGIKK